MAQIPTMAKLICLATAKRSIRSELGSSGSRVVKVFPGLKTTSVSTSFKPGSVKLVRETPRALPAIFLLLVVSAIVTTFLPSPTASDVEVSPARTLRDEILTQQSRASSRARFGLLPFSICPRSSVKSSQISIKIGKSCESHLSVWRLTPIFTTYAERRTRTPMETIRTSKGLFPLFLLIPDFVPSVPDSIAKAPKLHEEGSVV